MPDDAPSDPRLHGRLAYLLKHAGEQLARLHADALAPFSIDAGALSVLIVIAADEPPSQQQAAQRLGIDPTRMVAAIDALQDQGLVARRPDPDDRRRNVVELTDVGRRTLREATRASDGAERALLEPLDAAEARDFREALHRLVVGGDPRSS